MSLDPSTVLDLLVYTQYETLVDINSEGISDICDKNAI